MVSKFTIFWTSYSFEFPPILTKDDFLNFRIHYLSTGRLEMFKVKFGFLKEFWWHIVLIFPGWYGAFNEIYHFTKNLDGLLGGILLVISIGVTLSIIPSAGSFILNYFDKIKFYNAVKRSIMTSKNYNDFCIQMKNEDIRYLRFVS
jgi:hypothetical protein